VVHPRSAEEVSRICRIANNYKIPLTTWGGGSGSQGGALPLQGGIVLDTKKLNRILEIDKTSLTVTAETGIIMQHLEWALQREGLATMHEPASIGCATLGGFLAHRGTGVLSTKYGKIEDMIMSLEAVLPDGTIINTLAVPRHASGPDLSQLFLGSEGTYGVMTKATLKLHPLPEVRRFHAFVFPDLHTGLEAGRQLMVRRLRPCVIRLYDEAETRRLIRRVLGIEKDGAYRGDVCQHRERIPRDGTRDRGTVPHGTLHRSLLTLVRMGLHALRPLHIRLTGSPRSPTRS
jgi:alkyldihydroxyacetonephosphate synthase